MLANSHFRKVICIGNSNSDRPACLPMWKCTLPSTSPSHLETIGHVHQISHIPPECWTQLPVCNLPYFPFKLLDSRLKDKLCFHSKKHSVTYFWMLGPGSSSLHSLKLFTDRNTFFLSTYHQCNELDQSLWHLGLCWGLDCDTHLRHWAGQHRSPYLYLHSTWIAG
jgi:hypothetical protein